MRRLSMVGLAAMLVCGSAQADATAVLAEPWLDAPPFSVPADALLEKVVALPGADAPAEVLLDEMTISLDDASRVRQTYHAIYRVLSPAGVPRRSSFSIVWSPWRQTRPSVRARVVSADGVVHELDQATVTDAPLGDSESSVFSDRRRLEGPFPAVATGSIIEVEWTLEDTAPSFETGTSGRYVFGDDVPVRATRFVLDAPAALPLATRVNGLPSVTPVRSERDGRVHLRFESGPLPKLETPVVLVPYDVRQLPSVAFATCGSWTRVAGAYAAIVDRQISAARLGPQVNAVLKGVTARAARIEALVRELHRDVRYTGIEFGESSVVPARPDETLKRRFGDCKDKSTLLVAMLRAAGFDAHLALLETGFGPDTDADLPGFDSFDHAIVVVEGEPRVWIDATAEFFRAGDLPLAVAGRLALVAASTTTALERTPESPARSNRIERIREFDLAERGPARVVETLLPQGVFEGEFRADYATTAAADVRKNLEAFVASVFKSKTLGEVDHVASSDFSKPFMLTFEAKDAEVGETFADAAIVRFPTEDFVERLAASLPDDTPDPKASPADKPAARKLPFRLPGAFVDVWTVRVHPPPGFLPGAPPSVEDTRIGPIRYSRTYDVEADGTLTFRATVDTGDRLTWSAQELEDVRAWIEKLKADGSVQLVVEQTAYRAIREGKIQEAVREYQRLAALHPKEPLHRVQLADAYLQGGVGEAARGEVKRAVALDPASVEAWRMFGWVFVSDMVGRPFMHGSDLAEAEAAFRKALALDPKDESSRKNLAILLEYDPKSLERYGRGARLPEAIEVWRALRKDEGTNLYDVSIMADLARTAQWSALRDFAQEANDAQNRGAWLALATAFLDGPDAAIEEAGRQANGRTARDQLLLNAGQSALVLRFYPEAAALLRAAAQAAPQGAAAAAAQVEMIGKCRRHEALTFAGDTPEDLLKRFIVDLFAADDDAQLEKYLSGALNTESRASEAVDALRSGMRGVRSALVTTGLTGDGLADLMLALAEWRTEGDDALGFKTTIRTQVPGESRTIVYFTQRETGGLRIVGGGDQTGTLGAVALSRLAAGHSDQAKRWLEWARESFGDPRADFLTDAAFLSFWPPDPARGDAGLELAAAALEAWSPQAAASLPILKTAAARATSDDERIRIDNALRVAYWRLDRYAEAVEPARRNHAARPDSDITFDQLSAALLGAGGFEELNVLCDDRLAKTPDDVRAWRTRARLASRQRRWADVMAARQHVVDLGKANNADYNALAWSAMFLGDRSPRTVENAERAALFSKSPSAPDLHTLAAAYADVGRVVEALQTLIKEMSARGVLEPGPDEWLIIGRLAEQYGANGYAIAAYNRVTKPKDPVDLAGSPYELARLWLAGVAPPIEAGPAKRSARAAVKP